MGSLKTESTTGWKQTPVVLPSPQGGTCIFEAPEYYAFGQVLGFGAYGVVCSAINKLTGQKVAVKKVCGLFSPVKGKRLEGGDVVRVLREMQLMRSLRESSAIVPLIDAYFGRIERDDVYMVTVMMDSDLQKVVKDTMSKGKHLDEHQIKYMFSRILMGLRDLHAAGIAHRDLKPANILVNLDCEARLCDFNLARPLDDVSTELTDYVVTRYYRAPEILTRNSYDTASDIWSAGCVFAEMFGLVPLFRGKNPREQIVEIAKSIPLAASERLSIDPAPKYRGACKLRELFNNDQAYEFAMRMLQWDPRNRSTAADLLRDPYLYDVVDHEDLRVPTTRTVLSNIIPAAAHRLPRATLRGMVQAELAQHYPHHCVVESFVCP